MPDGSNSQRDCHPNTGRLFAAPSTRRKRTKEKQGIIRWSVYKTSHFDLSLNYSVNSSLQLWGWHVAVVIMTIVPFALVPHPSQLTQIGACLCGWEQMW